MDFIAYVSQLREANQYNSIYAADETAVWLDASSGKTVAEKGAKEVGSFLVHLDGMNFIFRYQC